MTKPILFLGESRQISDLLDTCHLLKLEVAGIIDQDFYGNTEAVDGIPFVGSENDVDWQQLKKDYDFFISINPVPGVPRNVEKRKRFINLVDQHGLTCANILDPQSRISSRAKLGQGIFVGFGACISPHVEVGDHCQLHYLAGVMHDCVLGRNVIVNRAAGVVSWVTIGNNVYLAPFSRILHAKTIGDDSVINSGVLVFRDVEPGETVRITGRKVFGSVADLGKDPETQQF